jgi:predicted nucleotidyltransferase
MQTYQDWQKRHSNKAELLKLCAAAIRKIVPQAEVILYGSVARGEETAESDVDLLVLVPQEATYELKRVISDQVYAIELRHDQLINLIVRQEKKWHSEPLNITPLYKSIQREGVQM